MAFPIIFGLTPFGGDLREQSHAVARRFEGDGIFKRDLESAHDLELLVEAEIHALGRQALDRAALDVLPDRAGEEVMQEWEDALDVPNSAARTLEQRRVRASMFKGLPFSPDITTLTALGKAILDSSGILGAGFGVTSVDRSWVVADDATPESIFHLVFTMPDVLFSMPVVRTAFDILERILPTRALGQVSREGRLIEQVGSSFASTWDGAVAKMGRAFLATSGATPHVRPPARYRDYGPLSRLCADDLNTVQDATLFGRDNQATGMWANTVDPDLAARFFDFSAAAAATVTLDDSIDWRDRMLQVVLRMSTTDIRPGNVAGSDELFNAATLYGEHLYTGTGGTGNYEQQLGASGVYILANAGTGALQLRNTTGSTQYGGGLVIACGDVGGH